MKALVLVEDTPASYNTLKVACEDFHKDADRVPVRKDELILVFIDCILNGFFLEEGLREVELRGEELLYRAASVGLESQVSLVEGEIIRCYERDVTEVLLEIAESKGVEVVYLPSLFGAGDQEAREPGLLSRFWSKLGGKNGAEADLIPVSPELNASQQIRISELARVANFKVVLTDQEGIVIRLSFLNKFTRNPEQKAEVAREAVQGKGWVEITQVRQRKIMVMSFAGSKKI